jgi:hypothetical protein
MEKKTLPLDGCRIYHWFDSVNLDRLGGVWYWDQRNHQGNGSNYTSDETNLDFLRFSTTKSYPAFAYCTINQNPGNGNVSNGAPYGAINGYLDWDDNSVDDQKCSYSIDCFVKDMYVGGVLQTQYDSCIRDVTLKRLQNFKPTEGQVIHWSVTKGTNKVMQSGNFTYHTSSPITVYGARFTGAAPSFHSQLIIASKKGAMNSIQLPLR